MPDAPPPWLAAMMRETEAMLTAQLHADGWPITHQVAYDTTPIKVGGVIPVSRELLDDRPPATVPRLRRRDRLRWWWAEARLRLGERVAGRRFEDDW